jgi:hypothetical protein
MKATIPVAEKRDLSVDPWMTLGEAVRFAAWRDKPEPRWGMTEFEDGSWTSHGDMEERDRLVYAEGADRIRAALAAGDIEAWAQTGYDEPVLLPQARWSSQLLGSIVSWIEFYHPFDRIIVERARVERLGLLDTSHPKAATAPNDVRSPSVKAGRPPSDEDILGKADEMKARGMTKYEIASKMRLESGFENVGTVLVRELTRGRWKPAGRPPQRRA